jgi:hypothetical protein
MSLATVFCLVAAACGSGETGGEGGQFLDETEPVPCGDKTPGSDEYCRVLEGRGTDVGFNDAGEWRGCGAPYYSCESIPDDCDPEAFCECEQFRNSGGECEEGRRFTTYAR